VETISDTNGQALHVSATAAQQTFVNSTSFTVTAGSEFQLEIKARISPDSLGSGVFALIFLSGGTEVSRSTLPFVPANVTLGTAHTGTDGRYSLPFAVQNPGEYQVQSAYAGTDTLWPAFSSASLDLRPSIKANGVVNGADFRSETLPPGAWFTIFGQNLGDAAHWTTPNTFTLGGAGVSVCGLQAAISYNSGPLTTSGVLGWQLNALMPDAIAGQTSCPVVVTVDGQVSQAANVSITTGVLELFGFTSSAGLLPVITHLDYSLVGPVSAGLLPATAAETVIGWGTGDCSGPTITVGGSTATVLFSARVAPGLCQINFEVPSSLTEMNQLAISTSSNSYVLWVAPQVIGQHFPDVL
jgi:uncharacterized protein (TIGR03437 family)